jgi:hypothetical protein
MTTRRFRLVHDEARRNAIAAIQAATQGEICRIGKETRSEAQNRLLHPLLQELADQLQWHGKKRSMLQWKVLMVSGHAIATGEPQEMTVGIEGEVVNLRESTASMTKARFSDLVEYVLAYGALNGVRFKTDRQEAAA